MRLAVVGGGIAGLACAWLLRDLHEVTLYEAEPEPGGHTRTLELTAGGRTWAVDTGFIVYNERTYPLFTRLLAELGVASQPSAMSFSVRDTATGLEYNGTSLDTLFAQRRNLVRPAFLRMLRDILRFNRAAPRVLGTAREGDPLGDWLVAEGFHGPVVEQYLAPMGAAVWSLPRQQLLAMPVGFFVRFFHNHGFLTVNDRPQWRVIQGGSREYVRAMLAALGPRVRAGHPVRRVERGADHVLVDGVRHDAVVLACHADQALAMLADPSPAEQEVLGAFPFQANEAVVHTDTRLLPRARRAWAAWNYLLDGSPGDPVPVTYNMNILQSLPAPETFLVTLNRGDLVDPAAVRARIRWHHPVLDGRAVPAQARHAEISGVRRTHYCGAWWRNGFHEDGLWSAVRVAAQLGVSW